MSGELEETYKALDALLKDEKTFNEVVSAVFKSIDKDGSGTIELNEIEDFIKGICEDMGISQIPDTTSISSVFNELDTDHSKNISKKELAGFLRLLFEEQKKQLKAMFKKN